MAVSAIPYSSFGSWPVPALAVETAGRAAVAGAIAGGAGAHAASGTAIASATRRLAPGIARIIGPARSRIVAIATNWSKTIIDEFHAKKGKGVGSFGDRLLLLTVHGAKSGRPRTNPLAYHRDGDRYVVAASMGGAPKHPAWYHNLVKHRRATIEVGDEKFDVKRRRSRTVPSAIASTRITGGSCPGSSTTRRRPPAPFRSWCWSASARA
jgi:deazaflavin-dependent oxidoreductase (nitroreductase family)